MAAPARNHRAPLVALAPGGRMGGLIRSGDRYQMSRIKRRMKGMACVIFGHNYRVLRRMTATQRKVGCARCKETWAMCDETRSLVEWDGVFEEMYEPRMATRNRTLP